MILPEIDIVGIYDSSVAARKIVISKKRKTSTFEIELPIEDGGVSYIDSASKKINSNMIICAKPGQVRCTKFPFRCYYIHMTVNDDLLYKTLMNTPNFLDTDKRKIYEKIFLKMINHYNTHSSGEEIILQSLILELIYTISKDSSIRNKSGRMANNYPLIESALNYIDEHLTESLSLEKVSKAMSVSPIHFHNTFKAYVGRTLRDYIEEQRITKATNLLLTTSYSLTQIAYECGFSSQSYFSYAFKRRMKITPREYVKGIYDKYET